MNAATIAAISTAAVSIIGAITALITSLKSKNQSTANANAINAHIATHNSNGNNTP